MGRPQGGRRQRDRGRVHRRRRRLLAARDPLSRGRRAERGEADVAASSAARCALRAPAPPPRRSGSRPTGWARSCPARCVQLLAEQRLVTVLEHTSTTAKDTRILSALRPAARRPCAARARLGLGDALRARDARMAARRPWPRRRSRRGQRLHPRPAGAALESPTQGVTPRLARPHDISGPGTLRNLEKAQPSMGTEARARRPWDIHRCQLGVYLQKLNRGHLPSSGRRARGRVYPNSRRREARTVQLPAPPGLARLPPCSSLARRPAGNRKQGRPSFPTFMRSSLPGISTDIEGCECTGRLPAELLTHALGAGQKFGLSYTTSRLRSSIVFSSSRLDSGDMVRRRRYASIVCTWRPP